MRAYGAKRWSKSMATSLNGSPPSPSAGRQRARSDVAEQLEARGDEQVDEEIDIANEAYRQEFGPEPHELRWREWCRRVEAEASRRRQAAIREGETARRSTEWWQLAFRRREP